MPIAPESRTTGTTGISARKRAGISARNAAGTRSNAEGSAICRSHMCECDRASSHPLLTHRGQVAGNDGIPWRVVAAQLYRRPNMKMPVSVLLMMSILMASHYRPADRRRCGGCCSIASQRQRLARRAAPPRPPRSAFPLHRSTSIPAAARAARGCPLRARTRTRIAGCPARPCTGSTATSPKPAVKRRQHLGQPVGAPDQRQRAGGMQHPRGGGDPAGKHASPAACAARRSGSGETFCRAGLLNGGFISTRSAEPGPMPRGGEFVRPAPSHRASTTRTRWSRPLRAIFSAAMPTSSGSISTSVTSTSGTAHRQRQPRRADARAELDHPIARPRGGRRRQQDGVVADAVAALLLREPQPAAEHRVVGGLRLRPARPRPQLMRQPGVLQQLPRRRPDARHRPRCAAAACRASLPARSCAGPAPYAECRRP